MNAGTPSCNSDFFETPPVLLSRASTGPTPEAQRRFDKHVKGSTSSDQYQQSRTDGDNDTGKRKAKRGKKAKKEKRKEKWKEPWYLPNNKVYDDVFGHNNWKIFGSIKI